MKSDLREIIALVGCGWKHVPVLVVGDVMLDQYVWGEVERISPEAPVPVVRALLRDENGVRLAKRHDALALRTLREQGFTPAEVRARFG